MINVLPFEDYLGISGSGKRTSRGKCPPTKSKDGLPICSKFHKKMNGGGGWSRKIELDEIKWSS